MPKVNVSIIVPCFNVAPWLARCLDSLIGQTLHNIEIICIDDKSTDNTLEILQEYAARDKRISVIALSKNSGVAFARNTGMENARGDYIGFVDPDDYVDLDFYEKLYSAAKTSGADIVKGNVLSTDMNNGAQNKDWKLRKIKQEPTAFSSYFWSAIYKSEFLKRNNISFPTNIIHSEDSVFLTQVCLHTKNIMVIEDTFYNYFYQRAGSLDSAILTHVKAVSAYAACNMSFDLIQHSDINGRVLQIMLANHVLEPIVYAVYKKYEHDSDCEPFFQLLHKLCVKYDMGQYIKSQFNNKIYNVIKHKNYRKFKKCLLRPLVHKRIYLFGFIPLLLFESWGGKTYIRIFDVITILKIKG